MSDLAVSIIMDYVQEYFSGPSLSWNKHEFKKRSYEQWAAHEVCERIMDRPFDPPIDIIEIFMFEMAFYACCGEDEQRHFIFQTAVEVAEELALLFI